MFSLFMFLVLSHLVRKGVTTTCSVLADARLLEFTANSNVLTAVEFDWFKNSLCFGTGAMDPPDNADNGLPPEPVRDILVYNEPWLFLAKNRGQAYFQRKSGY